MEQQQQQQIASLTYIDILMSIYLFLFVSKNTFKKLIIDTKIIENLLVDIS